ncbi:MULTISPECIES: toll/interleukin-1 receptor domain-containing protein [unclassified Amycolatopsis]|uniref:toll/interleukin-1 receptor domain-containing protein n=1 Tax=unclassified Amycolatopsis TaxID=2618356 RepID=UPI001F4635CD|nr:MULTISPECIES: toll/interleukin-1 receptor domain-containing protein [unclassified Amycolatopsis]
MTLVYEYDVFISYRRGGGDAPDWVRNHFLPRLRRLFDDNVDYDVKIFLEDSVPVGGKWPQEIRDALQRTRILIPVCSPKYFLDEWCLAEWHTMAKREEIVAKAGRLIYPVIFSDSEYYPGYAHERRMRSFRNWNKPHPQYQNTLEYLDFDREVERMVEELVEIIAQAPPWCPEWPVETPSPEPPRPSKLPRF